MPYRIVNMVKKGNTWTGQLQEWGCCISESTYTPFEIEQESSPTMKEILTYTLK